MTKKERARQRRNRRIAITLAAIVLTAVFAIGGTIAWLTDKTPDVKNTFTTSDVDIELSEAEELDLKMIPGGSINKDPQVIVKANSEKCWLFVKVEKSSNFDAFMTCAIANGWQSLPDTDGVYYREVQSTADDQTFEVLEGNKVLVKKTVTKANMDTLTETTLPTLTFTAYACQHAKGSESFTPADAWALVSPSTP